MVPLINFQFGYRAESASCGRWA